MPKQAVLNDAELAQRASSYLSTDHVRPAQATIYRALLTSGPTGDPLRDFVPELERRAVVAYAAGDLRVDKLPDVPGPAATESLWALITTVRFGSRQGESAQQVGVLPGPPA